MKIKQDYVTNSSSTAYIVCLPPKKEWILENIKNCEAYKEAIDDGGDISHIEELIDLLLRREPISEEEYAESYDAIRDLCYDHKFVICDFAVGSGGGLITNLVEDDAAKMAGILEIDWIKKITNGRGKDSKKEKT